MGKGKCVLHTLQGVSKLTGPGSPLFKCFEVTFLIVLVRFLWNEAAISPSFYGNELLPLRPGPHHRSAVWTEGGTLYG